MIRRQLPVYSPLPVRAIWSAAWGRLEGGENPRAVLADLLKEERRARRVILYGSGTQALQVAMRVAVDAVGGEVVLPAYTCFDVATAAVGAQVRVRFYDVVPETLGPDLASLEEALAAGSRVIVAGPLYGIPLDWEPIQDLARRYGAILLEDAAQAHGCRNGDREAGMTGDLSILSFGRGKGWTGGGGGALMVNSADFDDRVPALGSVEPSDERAGVLLVKTVAQWALGRPSLYGIPSAMPWLGLGETVYKEPAMPRGIGWRSALLALGTRSASRVEAETRRRTADAWLATLAGAGRDPESVKLVAVPPMSVPGYLRMPVLLSRSFDEARPAGGLQALGISRGYPMPLPDLKPLQSYRVGPPGSCCGGESLVESLVTIPTHGWLKRRDRERVFQAMIWLGKDRDDTRTAEVLG